MRTAGSTPVQYIHLSSEKEDDKWFFVFPPLSPALRLNRAVRVWYNLFAFLHWRSFTIYQTFHIRRKEEEMWTS